MPLPVVILMGPTAAGKSALALGIAKTHRGEIINADSRQVYVGMDVGTDKIASRTDNGHGKLERRDSRDQPVIAGGVPHYLIDILTPDQRYSAAEFRDDALRIIGDVHRRKKLPIVVGGTGFYIRVLTGDQTLPNVPPDPGFRRWAETQSVDALERELQTLAPGLAARVDDLRNRRRVTRALEITRSRRNKKKETSKKGSFMPRYSFLKLVLIPPWDVLHTRIESRVDRMLRQGLLNEVCVLIERYGASALGLQTPGYREAILCIAKRASVKETRAAIIRAHRKTARRQLTWLNKEPNLVRVTDATAAERLVRRFLAERKTDTRGSSAGGERERTTGAPLRLTGR